MHSAPRGSQTNKALKQSNAETNKTGDDEQKQKGLASDGINKGINPTNRGGNKGGYSGDNISHKNTPLQSNKTLNQANTKPNKGDNDKQQD